MAIVPTLTQPTLPSYEMQESDVSLAFQKGKRLLLGSAGITFKGFGGGFLKDFGLEEAGNEWLSDAYAKGVLMGMDVNEIDSKMKGPRTTADIEDWKGGLAWGVNAVAEQVPMLMGQFIPALVVGLLTKTTPLGRAAGAVGLGARGASTATALATIDFMNTAEVYSELLMETGESRRAVAATTGALMSVLDALVPLQVLGKMKLGPDFTRWFGKKLANPKSGLAPMIGRSLLTGLKEGTTEYFQTQMEGAALNYVQEKDKLFEFSEAMKAEQLEAAARGMLIGTLLGIPVSYRGGRSASQKRASKYADALENNLGQMEQEFPVSEDLQGFDDPIKTLIGEEAVNLGGRDGRVASVSDDEMVGFGRASLRPGWLHGQPRQTESTYDELVATPEGRPKGKRFGFSGVGVGDLVQWNQQMEEQIVSTMGLGAWRNPVMQLFATPKRVLSIENRVEDYRGLPISVPYATVEGGQAVPVRDLQIVQSQSDQMVGFGREDEFKGEVLRAGLEDIVPLSGEQDADFRQVAGLVEKYGIPGAPVALLRHGEQDPTAYMPPTPPLVNPFQGRGEIGYATVETGRRKEGYDPWTRTGEPETKTAKIAQFGYEITGRMPVYNKKVDKDGERVQSKDTKDRTGFAHRNIYENEDYIIQKETDLRIAPWVAISKETGEKVASESDVDATGEKAVYALAKAFPSAPIDVTVQTREGRLKHAEREGAEARALSFEQLLGQQGRLLIEEGDRGRRYVRDPDFVDPELGTVTGKWRYPENLTFLIKKIKHMATPLQGDQYSVGTPVTTVYEVQLDTGEDRRITILPTEENIRIVPVKRGAWMESEYLKEEPVTQTELILEDPLLELTAEERAELEQFSPDVERQEKEAQVAENRKRFQQMINNKFQRSRIAEALATVELVRGVKSDSIAKNYRKLQNMDRDAIEKFIVERYLDKTELAEKYTPEELQYIATQKESAQDRLDRRAEDQAKQIEDALAMGVAPEELEDISKPDVLADTPEGAIGLQAREITAPVGEEIQEVRSVEPGYQRTIQEGAQLPGEQRLAQPQALRRLRQEKTRAFEEARRAREKELGSKLNADEMRAFESDWLEQGKSVYKTVKSTKPAPFTEAEFDLRVSVAQRTITNAIKAAKQRLERRQDRETGLEAVPKGASLLEVIDPETERLPSPETHRIKIKPEVAKKHGLLENVFYPYETTGWSPPAIHDGGRGTLIRVQGIHIDVSDVIRLEESRETITPSADEFVEYFSENYRQDKVVRKKGVAVGGMLGDVATQIDAKTGEVIPETEFIPGYVVELPESIPDRNLVRRAWIRNKDGRVIVQKMPDTSPKILAPTINLPSMKLEELADYYELGYDYEVYRTWASREEHALKIEEERNLALQRDRESREVDPITGKVLDIKTIDIFINTDLRDNPKFLTEDYQDNVMRGSINVTLNPWTINSINSKREKRAIDPVTGKLSKDYKALPRNTQFPVSRAYGSRMMPPPGADFQISEKTIEAGKRTFPTVFKPGEARPETKGVSKEMYLDALASIGRKGKVDASKLRDRRREIEAGAQIWSTEGIPVPLKTKIVVTDRDGHQYEIPVTSAITAHQVRRNIPSAIGTMIPVDMLVEEGPPTGVELVASFRGNIKEDEAGLRDFIHKMFDAESNRFGYDNERMGAERKLRRDDMREFKGEKALVDFPDGTIMSGKIGDVRNYMFELVMDDGKKIQFDLLSYDRVQIDKPIVVKQGMIPKGVDPEPSIKRSNIRYYPVFGKQQTGPVHPIETGEGETRIEVTREGDDYFIKIDDIEESHRAGADWTPLVGTQRSYRFGLTEAIGFLNQLDIVKNADPFEIVSLPNSITYDTEYVGVVPDEKNIAYNKAHKDDVDPKTGESTFEKRSEYKFDVRQADRGDARVGTKEFKELVGKTNILLGTGRVIGGQVRTKFEFKVGREVELGPEETARLKGEGGVITEIKFNTGVTIRKPGSDENVKGVFDPLFVGKQVAAKDFQKGIVRDGDKVIARFIPASGKPEYEDLDLNTLTILYWDTNIQKLEDEIVEGLHKLAGNMDEALGGAGVIQFGMWDKMFAKNRAEIDDYQEAIDATTVEYLEQRKKDITEALKVAKDKPKISPVANDKIEPSEKVKSMPLGLIKPYQKFEDTRGTEWQVITQIGNIDRTLLRYIGGKKPSKDIFKVAYQGLKGKAGWTKGMEVIVESNITTAGLFTAIHKPSKKLRPRGKLVTKQGIETDIELATIPNFSVVRMAPLGDERGEISLNTGLTPKRFKEIIGKRVGRFNLVRHEKEGAIKIVQNQIDVPNAPQGIGIKGTIRNGKLWIITNNITEEEAMGVFTHELGVHIGLRELFGEEQFQFILESARHLRDSSPAWRDAFEYAEEVAARLYSAPHILGEKQKEMWENMSDVAMREFITEEAVGYYVEGADPYTDSFWTMVLDVLRRAKAKVKQWFGGKMTEAEMMAFVRGAVRGMMGRNLELAHNRVLEYYSAVLAGEVQHWDDELAEKISSKLKDSDSYERLQKVADAKGWRHRVHKFGNPFAYLPFQAKFRTMRGIMRGKLGDVEDAGKELLRIYDNLSQEDNEQLFDFFTDRYAKAENIDNKELRDISVRMKKKLMEIGEAAYERQLFQGKSAEQFHELHGAYLPQVFMYHILANKSTSTPFGSKASQQYWTDYRHELETSKREAMRPITDVQYLLYKAFTIPQEDMIIMDYLTDLSDQEAFVSTKKPTDEVYKSGKRKGERKEVTVKSIGAIPWVMPKQWVSFEDVGFNGKKIKKRTTLSALQNEIDNLNLVRDHHSTKAKESKAASDRIAILEKRKLGFYKSLGFEGTVGEEQLEAYYNSNYDTKNFRPIPKGRRYGSLAGLWVRKEIYEDIVGNADLQTGENGFVQRWMNPYGTHAKLVGIFKTLHVPLNPPTIVRNFISNLMLMQLGGLPFHKQPKYLSAALREMRGGDSGISFVDSEGKKFTAYELAQRQGIGKSTLTSAEIKQLEVVMRDMERHGAMGVLTHGRRLWKSLSEGASTLYQNIEVLGKVAFIMHALENRVGELEAIINHPNNIGADGTPTINIEDAAVQEANSTLFDYSEVSPAVKALRSSFFGAPFITFQVKVAPLIIKTALKHPARFLPYVMILAGIQAAFGSLPFVDDDWDKLKERLPEWAREKGHMAFLPWKDSDNRWTAIDFSYFFPWTFYSEFITKIFKGKFVDAAMEGGLIGPAWQIATAIATNKDIWSGQEITRESDSTSDQVFDIFNYGTSFALPSVLTRRGFFSAPSVLEALYRMDPQELEGKLMDAAYDRTNRYGEPKRNMVQSIMSLAGLTTYSVNPNAVAIEMKRSLSKERKLKTKMTSINQDLSLTLKQRTRKKNAIREKIDEIREERNEYIRKTSGLKRSLYGARA